MDGKQTAYLLLGGNLGDCVETFCAARREINKHAGQIVQASPLFTSPAWGFESENLFYNQALAVQTHLDPYALLRTLLGIEKDLGRVRPPETGGGKQYASRVIDIDILFYGNAVISDSVLNVPHPLLPQRAFALVPLASIAPELLHPQLHKTVRQLLDQCPDTVGEVRMYEHPSASAQNPAENGSRAVFPEGIRFIAIEGNIGAGKTTLSRLISKQFGAKWVTESFEENIFLPKFYRNKERYAFPLELTFLAERYRQAKEDFVQELFSPFIVSDFSISKSLIFAQNTLQDDEYSLFSRLYKIILTTLPQPDLYVYLHSDVSRLMKNIRRRGREYESNMDPAYLQLIEQGYMDYMRTLPARKSLVIETTEMDFVNNEADYREIVDRIAEAARKAVGNG
ncbi:MAG: 2-amino-4-hydroxy-6-hydroxymethyldihydropteridine diphosphokinase [Bacteroides sp.]|nr:2-amino-4-hydroxy-6-hydroxymethyldihydropteridine diphosphokinase [Ruminococcus flavefaciens]MCM1555262.1 2-amino-4-hydroxy-6-hydroxymethyldihydropteridine diphosphokinase [Bacteroides sp.]